MAKQQGKPPIPYVIQGSGHDQNLHFYERYDERFLFNKVATLLYVLDEGEQTISHIQERFFAQPDPTFAKRYQESLHAEVLFSALHQCETFFALLIALFQPLPHWLYLTTYETKEIKQAVRHLVADEISAITGSAITSLHDFVRVAVYTEVVTADPELAERWDENLDNVGWLIQQIGAFFLRYDRAYNSYKHGLRVMTGPHQLSVAPQDWNGTVRGPGHILQAAPDSLTYLQQEPVREVDGEKEIPIAQVTKAFSLEEAAFYLARMTDLLDTIKATRLSALKGGEPVERMNTLFQLDRPYVMQLERCEEFSMAPLRADEAHAYEQYVAHMRATAEAAQQQPAAGPSDPLVDNSAASPDTQLPSER